MFGMKGGGGWSGGGERGEPFQEGKSFRFFWVHRRRGEKPFGGKTNPVGERGGGGKKGAHRKPNKGRDTQEVAAREKKEGETVGGLDH